MTLMLHARLLSSHHILPSTPPPFHPSTPPSPFLLASALLVDGCLPHLSIRRRIQASAPRETRSPPRSPSCAKRCSASALTRPRPHQPLPLVASRSPFSPHPGAISLVQSSRLSCVRLLSCFALPLAPSAPASLQADLGPSLSEGWDQHLLLRAPARATPPTTHIPHPTHQHLPSLASRPRKRMPHAFRLNKCVGDMSLPSWARRRLDGRAGSRYPEAAVARRWRGTPHRSAAPCLSALLR